jgi:AcrR family transcriptional regulator
MVFTESKKRILATAARIFASKGYNGARIDEIAKEAKVNKALIYYYFESKEAILKELFSTFFRESTDFLLRFAERGGFGQNVQQNKKLFELEYEAYLASNSDLLKILFTESLKENTADAPLFRLVDLAGNGQDERLQCLKQNESISGMGIHQTMVTEFFTGVMPLVAYIVFKDKWCKHFNITQEQLKTFFNSAMEATHDRYHEKAKS